MAELPSYIVARARMLEIAPPLGAETVPLETALGRVLASPVSSDRAQPPFAVSAMDGYAVRSGDVASDGASLTQIGEVPAGGRFEGEVGPGQTVRIFTGAAIPSGADRVVIQENVSADGGAIRIAEAQTGGDNIRQLGIDFGAGDTLLEAGEAVTPMALALAAAANRAALDVIRRPRIIVLASGDELVEPGSEIGDTDIVNSASYGVAALATAWGAEARVAGILPDDAEVTRTRIDELKAEGDLLISVGGASVGDYDLIRPAVTALGGEILIQKVAIRPGKPTWCARFDGGAAMLGLPGNPASALVCAHLFLLPMLLRMQGRWAGELGWRKAFGDAPLKANGAREHFLRGTLRNDDGKLRVGIAPSQDSSLLTPFVKGNALIRRAIDAPATEEGDLVDVLPLGADAV